MEKKKQTQLLEIFHAKKIKFCPQIDNCKEVGGLYLHKFEALLLM